MGKGFGLLPLVARQGVEAALVGLNEIHPVKAVADAAPGLPVVGQGGKRRSTLPLVFPLGKAAYDYVDMSLVARFGLALLGGALLHGSISMRVAAAMFDLGKPNQIGAVYSLSKIGRVVVHYLPGVGP